MTVKTLRQPDDFIAAGLAAPTQAADIARVATQYAVAMTPELAALVNKTDANDPILAQFRPDLRELELQPEENNDPIGDAAHTPVKGVVHRHPDRVLLKAVSVCPVYCRFCFRREMVGPDKDNMLHADELDAALAYIRDHDEIWEVILTGGDPFMLSPRRAADITRALNAIPHVRVIRWHTRMPVASPARVTREYALAIRSQDKAVFVAAHINHARELSEDARAACARLIDAGIPMLSQSVLLRGVNDSLEALSDLMRALVETRIRPYYLHHPDLAPGTSHFRLPIAEGQSLVRALRDSLSGLCTPTYVVDIPGGVSKAIASPSDTLNTSTGMKIRGRDDVLREHPDI